VLVRCQFERHEKGDSDPTDSSEVARVSQTKKQHRVRFEYVRSSFVYLFVCFSFLGYEPRVRRLATQVVKARSTRSQSAFFAYFAIYHEFAAHNNWPYVGGQSYRITVAIVTYFETEEHVIHVVD